MDEGKVIIASWTASLHSVQDSEGTWKKYSAARCRWKESGELGRLGKTMIRREGQTKLSPGHQSRVQLKRKKMVEWGRVRIKEQR